MVVPELSVVECNGKSALTGPCVRPGITFSLVTIFSVALGSHSTTSVPQRAWSSCLGLEARPARPSRGQQARRYKLRPPARRLYLELQVMQATTGLQSHQCEAGRQQRKVVSKLATSYQR